MSTATTQKSSSLSRRFGRFGGCYVPELLIAPLQQLQHAFETIAQSESFRNDLQFELQHYAGRPTALTEVPRFANAVGDIRVFLKREDLLHTGAHKLNNALGQVMLAKAMGKTRILAETGAGQHGVAVATACARLDMKCTVHMGRIDAERQHINVQRMQLLGATVQVTDTGSATLKDAINEALRDWATCYDDSHYCLGSALGPAPFPDIVREFQSVIGREARRQIIDRIGRVPDMLVACVGGGSNAIGLFDAFNQEADQNTLQRIGVEAGGCGKDAGQHAARFSGGRPGVLHGCFTYLLQDQDGQIQNTHSISAGLDYPAVGPEHADFFERGVARYETVSDTETLQAMQLLSKTEGIIPALESSHALAWVVREAKTMPQATVVLINLSGRGDKDLPQLFEQNLLQEDLT